MCAALSWPSYFNPLSPHGERPGCIPTIPRTKQFQSTLPAWGETGKAEKFFRGPSFQSTLPAWGETAGLRRGRAYGQSFQSTLPAWGETQARGSALTPWTISIHSPRMGRDAVGAGLVPCPFISIHSPRMGRDLFLWGLDHVVVISIHSPRMGRDLGKYPFAATAYYFNPLSPHGERPA